VSAAGEHLSILWRGPLSSCNYDCPYCPFGKNPLDRAEIARDAAAMARFLTWVDGQERPLSVFFTPWGEGLVHAHYRDALARLSRMSHVRRAAIQTNLSANLGFLEHAEAGKIGLWSTYHPGEVSLARFVAQVERARALRARVSAGVVATLEHLDDITRLRAAISEDVYVWVNAVSGVSYTTAQVAQIEAVDPLFRVNLSRPYPSLGRACRAGETVIAVDGEGNARRCHFLPEPIGNLYAPGFEAALKPRACTKVECRCHIGYVHMPELGLYDAFAGGVLERIPRDWGSSEKCATPSSGA